MSPPRLPQRLRGVLALVPQDARCVADIGAGHGALSVHLARAGLRVIATEAQPGPLAELTANLRAWRAADGIEVRSGRDLLPLREREADTVVMAGVGARTALAVTEQAAAKGVRWVILQCMQRSELVEPGIDARGWLVLHREDVRDARRTYPTWLIAVGP